MIDARPKRSARRSNTTSALFPEDFGLPPAMLATARWRLGRAAVGALVVSGVQLGLLAFESVFGGLHGVDLRLHVGVNVLFTGLSLALAAFERSPAADTAVLRAGTAWAFVAVIGFALGTQHHDLVLYGGLDAPASSALVLVLFGLFLPMPWRLAALFMAASAVVIGLSGPFAVWLEGTSATFLDLTRPFYVGTVAAGVAFVGSRWIHRLNVEVAEAKRLGAYTLESRIGAGGMGEVWRARHALLARPAAVKLVRSDALAGLDAAEQEATLARFEREAQATANLRSPHSVQLYDFGRTDDGSFYYVMELLDGVDLETFMHQYGPMPVGRALSTVAQACRSLADAHRLGLVHQDIKPANLMLTRRGAEVDVVKVLDFGIVALRSDRQGTRAGDQPILGTPAYVAPETLRGERVDGRSDLYSLGCTAYLLLTGTRVFDAASPMLMASAHLYREPERPSARRPELPPEVDDVVMRLLAKDPAERPFDADALADELSALLVRFPWTAADAQAWWDGHRPRPTEVTSDRHRATATFLLRTADATVPEPDA